MAKLKDVGVLLPFVSLSPTDSRALYWQLVEQLRETILSGKLKGGQRLPATRTLSSELNVSRSTIVFAFEHLVAEGYLVSKVGAGTSIAQNLPIAEIGKIKANSSDVHPDTKRSKAISGRGLQIIRGFTEADLRPTSVGAFTPNIPALDLFPYRVWNRLAGRIQRASQSKLMNYGDAGGYGPLRETIADYILANRGILCSPEQVIITTGTQRSITLVASLLLERNDNVFVEDPTAPIIRQALKAQGTTLLPIPIDSEGIDVAKIENSIQQARLTYVTPSCQYPLGTTLSASRRLALLSWAEKQDAWIFEDDEDSEFRFSGRPIPAMSGIDKSNRVIYNWSFSKILFPSLRLGVLVVPSNLVEAFEIANGLIDRGPPLWSQALLCEFIKGGHLASHTRRMRSAYAERRNALFDALEKHSEGLFKPVTLDSGMRTIVNLPDGIDDRHALHSAMQNGISCYALSDYQIKRNDLNGLLLGFSCVPEEAMRPAVAKLVQATQSLLSRKSPIQP